ncbi:hypothetical protein I4U23_023433 [Adineta vaga]|nr:hypothetical protein I4U23_023433 [Adineta vaga]
MMKTIIQLAIVYIVFIKTLASMSTGASMNPSIISTVSDRPPGFAMTSVFSSSPPRASVLFSSMNSFLTSFKPDPITSGKPPISDSSPHPFTASSNPNGLPTFTNPPPINYSPTASSIGGSPSSRFPTTISPGIISLSTPLMFINQDSSPRESPPISLATSSNPSRSPITTTGSYPLTSSHPSTGIFSGSPMSTRLPSTYLSASQTSSSRSVNTPTTGSSFNNSRISTMLNSRGSFTTFIATTAPNTQSTLQVTTSAGQVLSICHSLMYIFVTLLFTYFL